MKKLAITIACFTLSLYTYGQGTIQFDTSTSGNPVLNAAGINASTAYSGQLWGSTTGDTGSFAPIGTAQPFFGDTVDEGAGFIIDGIVTVSGTLGKKDYWVELHAWNTANPAAESGTSAPLKLVLGGDDGSGGVPAFPAGLGSLQGFTMVPEPSTIALGLLGAAALLLRRRN
jgi:hypothetical protein